MQSNAIDKAFKDAIEDGVFPSADICVARGGEIVHSGHYGNARAGTCFDIASLTKPICTATLAAQLFTEGVIKLTDTVYEWLGGARQSVHREMTIEHLLNHTAGLPPTQPYFRGIPLSLIGTDAGKRFILDECYAEPVIAEPGVETIYSDIGYIMLGEIIEQGGGAPLDTLFKDRIATPLGLKDTFFMRTIGTSIANDQLRHGDPNSSNKRRFAPTEDCPWRERVVRGEVHDPNAYALGGVAGHAGLFSTAKDINLFVTEYMKCFHGKSTLIPKDTVRLFLQLDKPRKSEDDFVLGWNRPSLMNSSAGIHFSPKSIGHLGYTGSSIWIDIERDFWVILLTNRVHPSTMNEKIKRFRPMIHNLIFDEVICS